MKVNYFGYCFKSPDNKSKVLHDLRGFLTAFCSLENSSYKNKFYHQDEHVYLLHHIDDVFLFIITRSQELIRKVDTESISVGEIHSLLEENEQLGFASYVIFKDNYFGFASTLLAPKVDVFTKYINSILDSLGIVEWRFVPQVLLYQASKSEALKMDFIGRTTIELSKENSFFQDILASVTADTTDTIDLESIEIIIKPKKRKNIKETVDKFLNCIPDDGVQKMIMKAKGEGLSQMTDLYLVGSGAVSDSVDRSKESKIPVIMEEKIASNVFLKQKVKEYVADEGFEKNTPSVIFRYHNASAWADFISNIQQGDSVEQ